MTTSKEIIISILNNYPLTNHEKDIIKKTFAMKDRQDNSKLLKCYKCQRETSMKFCVDCVALERKQRTNEILKMIEKLESTQGFLINTRQLENEILKISEGKR